MSQPVLPRFGMGTAAIGNLYRALSDDEAMETVAAALAAGIGYFDTAPHYGFGLAERRLGAALALHDPAQTAIVSTKVGRLLVPTELTSTRHGFVDADPFDEVYDYSADGVRLSLEASIERLQGRRIDIVLAHDLGVETHGGEHPSHRDAFLNGGYQALCDLRDAGVIGAVGIGVNEIAICEELLDAVPLDVILLAGRYTLLDRRAEALLDRCAALGVRVIAGGPYNSGILAHETIGADIDSLRFDYALPSAQIVARARALASVAAQAGVSLPAAALQFPLRHPAVASVIAGLAGAEQIEAMVARIAAEVPAAAWEALDGVITAAPLQMTASGPLILLHPDDNVLICVAPISAGDRLLTSSGDIPAREDIMVGHKVARWALSAGDKIIKYGAPIGSMTAAVTPGEWVHMHNMKSDYIAAHSRTTVSETRS
jgi:D-threo-aldose 1-dehydrogenase